MKIIPYLTGIAALAALFSCEGNKMPSEWKTVDKDTYREILIGEVGNNCYLKKNSSYVHDKDNRIRISNNIVFIVKSEKDEKDMIFALPGKRFDCDSVKQTYQVFLRPLKDAEDLYEEYSSIDLVKK